MKKLLCIIITLAIMLSLCAAATSVSVMAEEKDKPEYVQTFTKDNFLGFYSYKGSSDTPEDTQQVEYTQNTDNLTFYDDGSFTIDSKDAANIGVRVLFSIDDAFMSNMERAKKNADDLYAKNVETARKKAEAAGQTFDPATVAKVNPFYKFKWRVEKSLTKKGYMKDTFVFYGFIKNDNTLLPSIYTGGDMYRTLEQNFTMQYKHYSGYVLEDGPFQPLTDFSDIKGIFIELFHWNPYDKAVTFSGLTVSGDPEIKDFIPPEVDPEATTHTAVDWDINNRQDYGNAPYAVKYSTDNGVTNEYSKNKNSGWMKWENRDKGVQFQTYFFFNRDDFNKSLLIANKEGGSHKFWITFQLDGCVDQDNEPCKANIQVQFVFYKEGYVTMIDDWQEPGTAKTYAIDVSNIDLNSMAGVKCAVQNYRYFDKDKNIVEYMTKGPTSPEYDTFGSSIHYGTGVQKAYICPQVCISPITVAPVGVEPTSVAHQTEYVETTTAPTDNPGAGFHFFDFLPETQAEAFENAPDEIKYVEYTEKPGVDKLYDKDYGKVEMITPTRVHKQHQMGWYAQDANGDESKGYCHLDEAVKKNVYNQMKQALAYANGPGGLHLLCCDASLISATHAATKEDCTVECQVMLHCAELEEIKNDKWCQIGGSTTIMLDVTDLKLDDLRCVRLNPMNYSNVDPATGNACGFTNLDIIFSAIYVAGNQFATTTKAGEQANAAEADKIWKLYKNLPETFLNEHDVALLGAFIYAYADASVATQELLESKYGLTMDDYGALLELYNSLGGFIDYDDGVDTGAAAMPIAAMLLALSAGYVIVKSKKK